MNRPDPALSPPTDLLTRPTNRETNRIFVAATRMNDGKTTTCLGLFAVLQSMFPRVGFIKPVGQRFVEVDGLKVDEDSHLLDTIYHLRVPAESMSPVTVDATFTRRFLDNPDVMYDQLVDRICRSFDRVSWEKDFTLIEGTGHAGVGAVFQLSNARVARLLEAKVILVTQGGIGRPIDEIALNKALFDQEGVELIGVIINKVEPAKLPLIRHYASIGLQRLGIPLLGILPEQRMLSAPNLQQVADEIGGRWLNGRESGRLERIQRVIIGAMSPKGIVDYLQPGVLLIAPGDREDVVLAAIAASAVSGTRVVSGIILTRDILPSHRIMELISRTGIPVIAAEDDSYVVASKINNMTIKTQPQDADKFAVIKQLITDNIEVKQLLAAF